MKYLIISNSLVIYTDGKTFTIEPSDQRHEALMKEFQASEINEEKIRDILFFRLSPKVKHCEIIDGQFLINGQEVPEPFLSFFMKEKSNIPRFEFFYNLYFTLTKAQRLEELQLFKFVINQGYKLIPFSPKEEICLVEHCYNVDLPKDSIFKHVREPITEEMINSFISKHFKKNMFKAFKNYIFKGHNNISWAGLTENFSFILNFKHNEDKVFTLIEEMTAEGVNFNSHFHFMNPEAQAFMVEKLKALKIESISDLKRFFGGWSNLMTKINQLHNILEEVKLYQIFYNNEVYFNNLSRLNFQQYQSVLNPKLQEWREKHESKLWSYFNLPQLHPWLLDLEPMEHPVWGKVEFAFPNRGLELDMWSNTMNNCIRSYKKDQANSVRMILLNINCPQQKLMLATLELQVSFQYGKTDPQLYIQQFVGQGNSHMKSIDPELYESAFKQLYEKFDTYIKNSGNTGAYARRTR